MHAGLSLPLAGVLSGSARLRAADEWTTRGVFYPPPDSVVLGAGGEYRFVEGGGAEEGGEGEGGWGDDAAAAASATGALPRRAAAPVVLHRRVDRHQQIQRAVNGSSGASHSGCR